MTEITCQEGQVVIVGDQIVISVIDIDGDKVLLRIEGIDGEDIEYLANDAVDNEMVG